VGVTAPAADGIIAHTDIPTINVTTGCAIRNALGSLWGMVAASCSRTLYLSASIIFECFHLRLERRRARPTGNVQPEFGGKWPPPQRLNGTCRQGRPQAPSCAHPQAAWFHQVSRQGRFGSPAAGPRIGFYIAWHQAHLSRFNVSLTFHWTRAKLARSDGSSLLSIITALTRSGARIGPPPDGAHRAHGATAPRVRTGEQIGGFSSPEASLAP